MESTALNKAQIEVIQALSALHSDEEVYELKRVLARFFANRAQNEIERLWDEGIINEDILKSYENAHFRTPYK
ncbi:MAG: dephospho-CoA kinase [Bacteroidales bacterium]|nr:dephospho-CoA kinase [Bacteroidales bacterium]